MLWLIPVLLLLIIAAVFAYFFRFAHLHQKEIPKGLRREGPEWETYNILLKEGLAWLQGQQTEDLYIRSFDGLRLHGTYIPAENPRACVILFHGYRSWGLRDYGILLPFYHKIGLSMVVVDQRACGESEGKYITFGALERQDALFWARHMEEKLGGKTPLILDGISMGGATVLFSADLPLPETVVGLIADCGFTSPWDIIAHCAKSWFHIPPFPMLYLMSILTKVIAGFGYKDCSSPESLKHNTRPLLLLHGGADDFVPTDMSRQSFAANAGWKKLFIVPEAGHGMSYMVDMERCQQELIDYMDFVLGGR